MNLRKVLIVAKTTNFEHHHQKFLKKVAEGTIPASELEELRKSHEIHVSTLNGVLSFLEKKSIQYDLIKRSDPFPSQMLGYGCVISVGGDGTLLHVAQRLTQTIPCIAIRSSHESVGFLCTVNFDNYLEFLERWVDSRRPSTKEVLRIRAKIIRHHRENFIISPPILNDFLFTNSNPAAMTRYLIHWQDMTEFQKSSGIWISTSSGSTAAIFAAGGEKMEPSSPFCQFKVREIFTIHPNKNSKSITHGIFDPEQNSFWIENRNEKAILALDGTHGQIHLEFGDKISFMRGEPLHLLS